MYRRSSLSLWHRETLLRTRTTSSGIGANLFRTRESGLLTIPSLTVYFALEMRRVCEAAQPRRVNLCHDRRPTHSSCYTWVLVSKHLEELQHASAICNSLRIDAIPHRFSYWYRHCCLLLLRNVALHCKPPVLQSGNLQSASLTRLGPVTAALPAPPAQVGPSPIKIAAMIATTKRVGRTASRKWAAANGYTVTARICASSPTLGAYP